MLRSAFWRLDQFPLTLAHGLRATFADVTSDPLPDGLTALVSRLDQSQPSPQTRGQKHGSSAHPKHTV
jgi:Anti-sigma factor NepR